jgi:hypothetical protein
MAAQDKLPEACQHVVKQPGTNPLGSDLGSPGCLWAFFSKGGAPATNGVHDG